MIEVHPNLFVGNQLDYEKQVKGKDWSVVQACKEPYHRQALGYKGMGAPRDHENYYFLFRTDGDTRRMILNMVDAPKPEFFHTPMIDEALTFIDASLAVNSKVLVHCNQGVSRSAGIAMLYLRRFADVFEGMPFAEAEDVFRGLYPPLNLGAGMRAYLEQQWSLASGSD